MLLTEQIVLQTLMQWRTRISAAAWVVVRNTHASEDIFQNVVVKAMTRDVSFESESAVLSWAFITARREGLDWLARHRREVHVLDGQLLQQLEQQWQASSAAPTGAKLEALQNCLDATTVESRQLLRLRYGHDLDCAAVAKQLNLSLTAVYKRLSRLHMSLKQCVENKLSANAPGGFSTE